jgi:Leucine Rich repeat
MERMAIVRLKGSQKDDSIDAKDVLYYLEEKVSSSSSSKRVIDRLTCNGVWTDEDVNKLDSFLRSNKTVLRTLQLSNNDLTESSSASLARIILTALKDELDLSDNQIRSKGLAKLKLSLVRSDCTLKYLNLSNNKLGPAGGPHLASIIQGNGTIRELNLAHNQLAKRGVKAIVSALMSNKTLRSLNLSHNCIGDNGAILFAPVLDPDVSQCKVVSVWDTSGKIVQSTMLRVCWVVQYFTNLCFCCILYVCHCSHCCVCCFATTADTFFVCLHHLRSYHRSYLYSRFQCITRSNWTCLTTR